MRIVTKKKRIFHLFYLSCKNEIKSSQIFSIQVNNIILMEWNGMEREKERKVGRSVYTLCV